MSEPASLPPPEEPNPKKAINWPLAINLIILLMAAVTTKFNMATLSSVIAGLVLVNGLAGIGLLMVGHRVC